ncbi:MAG: LamG-like jellyroll fold domain-containing protein, partial [Planctomycetia bacterium]
FARAEETNLVARWPLAGDGRDVGPQWLHADGDGVAFVAAGATFRGRGEQLTVPAAAPLDFKTGDFTVSLHLHTDAVLDDDPGDLVAQYDPEKRRGWSLCLRTSTGVANAAPMLRQLQFAVDDGSEPTFTDAGKPGAALLAFAFAVWNGDLYAGTCEPGDGEAGRVYKFAAPDRWIDVGAPDAANAVMALIEFDGALYAGTGKYRVAGSSLPESKNMVLGGGVYRCDGGKWTPCGRLPDSQAVGSFASFGGKLYATSLYKPAGFFRYEGGETWTRLETPGGKRPVALAVNDGALYAGGYDEGCVYQYDGSTWTNLGRFLDDTQTYSFAPIGGRLAVGSWPSGKAFRLTGDAAPNQYEDVGRLGQELEVMGMLPFSGKLYAGTLPSAQVYRWDGGGRWTLLKQLDATPDVKYRRAWTMASYGGRLFTSTLPSGRIHAMKVGEAATVDRSLSPGWRHVAAVKKAGRLTVYVDGAQAAESTPFPTDAYTLTTAAPLTIGGGPVDSFAGRLKDVRLYNVGLDAAAIRDLAVSK